MVPVAPIFTGITLVFTFHMRCISIVRSLYFKIFSDYYYCCCCCCWYPITYVHWICIICNSHRYRNDLTHFHACLTIPRIMSASSLIGIHCASKILMWGVFGTAFILFGFWKKLPFYACSCWGHVQGSVCCKKIKNFNDKGNSNLTSIHFSIQFTNSTKISRLKKTLLLSYNFPHDLRRGVKRLHCFMYPTLWWAQSQEIHECVLNCNLVCDTT